ncbi:hypothetical protein NDU88_006366 [Pleurodeles waltl]|uniref:Uncharacterized protein n=1 Tax=Pleurodeles waltl TaxID=8319 RepID=A0AAV7QLJ6_PLEWA|nr:hypothetical protein NDU88_006366 [Pleurodeles waltl]
MSTTQGPEESLREGEGAFRAALQKSVNPADACVPPAPLTDVTSTEQMGSSAPPERTPTIAARGFIAEVIFRFPVMHLHLEDVNLFYNMFTSSGVAEPLEPSRGHNTSNVQLLHSYCIHLLLSLATLRCYG